jgi:hypothetical protein
MIMTPLMMPAAPVPAMDRPEDDIRQTRIDMQQLAGEVRQSVELSL